MLAERWCFPATAAALFACSLAVAAGQWAVLRPGCAVRLSIAKGYLPLGLESSDPRLFFRYVGNVSLFVGSGWRCECGAMSVGGKAVFVNWSGGAFMVA